MQKQKRKEVLKWIKSVVAPQLPEDTYKAYHKYFTPRIEETEEGQKVLRYGYLQDHVINHGRRLKKVYDTYGLMGIQGYLSIYGRTLIDK
jgi:hypothetical protein